MKMLRRTEWGANQSTLLKTYKGYLRPILDFGSLIYDAVPQQIKTLQKLQKKSSSHRDGTARRHQNINSSQDSRIGNAGRKVLKPKDEGLRVDKIHRVLQRHLYKTASAGSSSRDKEHLLPN